MRTPRAARRRCVPCCCHLEACWCSWGTRTLRTCMASLRGVLTSWRRQGRPYPEWAERQLEVPPDQLFASGEGQGDEGQPGAAAVAVPSSGLNRADRFSLTLRRVPPLAAAPPPVGPVGEAAEGGA
mmetsp:Transcript_73541/g.239347  ORF Transcript_73541/g.239347 Transcript_73541/m.239347 type:complete len:126 (-) Transcript_73541:44-421(-)